MNVINVQSEEPSNVERLEGKKRSVDEDRLLAYFGNRGDMSITTALANQLGLPLNP
jgi:hypothetical protein